MAEKVYLKCSAKARQTQFGEDINVGIKAEDLAEFCRKYKNERGYVNLTISARKETGQYGDTHSVYLDTYQPRERGEEPTRSRHSEPVTDSDIPF